MLTETVSPCITKPKMPIRALRPEPRDIPILLRDLDHSGPVQAHLPHVAHFVNSLPVQ
jgi:hypothetical protein